MQFHPDRTNGDPAAEERFKQLSEAYAVLSDPKKRTEYDRFGQVKEIFPGGDPDGRNFTEIFGDIFGDLFGGRRRRRPERGRDLRYQLKLEFDEAVDGCERSLEVPRKVACDNCAGSGAKPGSVPAPCETCMGSGQVRVQQGFFSVQRDCHSCKGRGRIVIDPCRSCRGSGRVHRKESLTIRVPRGVDDGQRLRVATKGEEGTDGGPSGDLIVVVEVQPHSVFSRDGLDLLCELPLSFSQATLGDRIEVPTLVGTVRMKVPAGTQSGRVFRLRGKGVAPANDGTPGDVRLTAVVETPEEVDDETVALLRQLDTRTQGSQPRRAEFAKKVKSLRKRKSKKRP